MGSIRWDTLVVVAIVALFAPYLLAHGARRITAARLLEIFRLAWRDMIDEPNLYELYAERRGVRLTTARTHDPATPLLTSQGGYVS